MARPIRKEALEHLKDKTPLAYINRGTGGGDPTSQILQTQGIVTSLTCYNKNAASRFLLLFDQNSSLSGGETDFVEVFLVPAGSQIVIGSDYFTDTGRWFDNGIVWCFSTSASNYTAGSIGDQVTKISYKQG